jgi:CubicO group peptidase (beta-lactamase class C family)
LVIFNKNFMKNSESKEQEVERNAAIILVIGTSSAGKSVLINKIKALDELRPEGERINWDENGVDMEGPRQWAALDPARKDSQFKSLLTHTVNEDGNRGKFTQSEVDGLILNGTLLVGDAIISLSDKGVDIGKFRQSLSIEDQSKYTEESILKLQNLTEKYHSLYEDTVERVSNVKVMEAIFARAVENSKKGIPSLLDVVPWDYYDVMGKFKEYTSSHGLSNVSSVVVAHCDIAQLTEHMDQRNAKADVEERRDTTTPFKQYADMYQTCKEREDGIGSFTVQNLVDAVEKFGKKSDSKELKQLEPGFLPQEVQDLLTKLEVPAEEWSLIDKPIKVKTRDAYSSYDLLCQTDEKSGIGITSTIAIDDIVKDIDGIVSKALERESELERRSEEISEQENKLANQYRSQISKQCFDKFFSEEAISSGVEEKFGDDGPTPKFILNTFILHEALQHSQQAKALLPVGEIKSQEDLDKIFKHVGLEHLRSIDRDCLDGVNNLTILPKLEFQSSGLAPNTSQTLEQHINKSSFFGDIHISQCNSTHKAHSADIEDNTPFCIHSVGKVLTGILVVKMLQESILTEAQLDKTVELDEEVVGQLPPLVQERLKSTTLRQLMTHQSGLTDYLSGYTQAIEDGLDGRGEVPKIQKPEDYLKFAENRVVDLKEGETNYSNLGSLLTGLAIQTAYNKKHPDNRLSYNQILKEKILDPAGIKQFSIQNPGNGSTNPNDRTAPHLCGGPAGGHWTTAQDLDKFGKWVCKEWEDPKFRELVEKHGQEFYDPKQNSIGHNGSIASASANLQIFPEENLVSVVLASRPQAAFQANRAIVRQFQENLNIESKKMKDLPNPERSKEPSSSPSPVQNKIKQVGGTSNTPSASSL